MSTQDHLSAELGMDVDALEQHLRFRIDLARLQQGKTSELGYLLIDRQDHPDAAVVFDTVEQAEAALEDHPLIDSLCQEDCLHAYVPAGIALSDITDREIILPA